MSNGGVYLPPQLREGATKVNQFVGDQYNISHSQENGKKKVKDNSTKLSGTFGNTQSQTSQSKPQQQFVGRDISGVLARHSFFNNNDMIQAPSEIILFSDQNTISANYDAYKDVEVHTQNGEEKTFNDFSELKVNSWLKKNIIRCKYSQPTPVQQFTILHVQDGRDMQVQANTGSGKTAAFAIPSIDSVLSKHNISHGKVAEPAMLIVLPTRELAQQTAFNFYRLSYGTGLRCRVAYGGSELTSEMIRQLRRGCDVLIGCPGKLIDFYEKQLYTLSRCQVLVIDEADRCLDMGFEPQIRQLVRGQDLGPHQTLLFSATFSRTIQKLADDLLHNPVRVTVGNQRACESVHQELKLMHEDEKMDACINLLETETSQGKAIVFCETKQKATDVGLALRAAGVATEILQGDMEQVERSRAMARFRDSSRVLVATDCAQRGLDVANVVLVINYDCPHQAEDYIHRVGRTGRAGQEGHAVTFLTSEDNGSVVADIIREVEALGQTVPSDVKKARFGRGGGFGGRGGRGGRGRHGDRDRGGVQSEYRRGFRGEHIERGEFGNDASRERELRPESFAGIRRGPDERKPQETRESGLKNQNSDNKEKEGEKKRKASDVVIEIVESDKGGDDHFFDSSDCWDE